MNTCVLLRSESIEAITDPLLSLALFRDEQRLSLGEFVDGSYHPSKTVNITCKKGMKMITNIDLGV